LRAEVSLATGNTTARATATDYHGYKQINNHDFGDTANEIMKSSIRAIRVVSAFIRVSQLLLLLQYP